MSDAIRKAVREELAALLAEGAPYTSLPLVDPATKLLPQPTVDAIRRPLEEAVTDLDEAVEQHGTALGTLEELTTTGRLSEQAVSNTNVGRIEADRVDLKGLAYADGLGVDDVTDWGPYLRTALGSGGREVQLPGGTVNIATKVQAGDLGAGGKWAVTIPSGTILRGHSMTDSIIRADDALPHDTPLIKVWGAHDVILSDFQLDGNKQRIGASLGEDEGISIGPIEPEATIRPARVWLNRIWVHDAGQDNIDNDGCDDLLLTDVISENAWGLGMHNRGFGSGNVVIKGFIARNNAHERLAAGGMNAPSACAIDYQGGIGQGRLILSDYVLEGNAKGIILANASRSVIGNGAIRQDGTAGPCLQIDGPATVNTEINVIGGLFEGGTRVVDIAGGRNIALRDLMIRMIAGTEFGIYAAGYDGLGIYNPEIHRIVGPVPNEGIRLMARDAASTRRFEVSGGRIEGVYYGVRLWGATAGRIHGVHINAGQDAVRAEQGASNVSVTHNHLRGIRAMFMSNAGSAPSNITTAFNELVGSSAAYTAIGTGHVKASNMENGAFTA